VKCKRPASVQVARRPTKVVCRWWLVGAAFEERACVGGSVSLFLHGASDPSDQKSRMVCSGAYSLEALQHVNLTCSESLTPPVCWCAEQATYPAAFGISVYV